MSNLENVGDRLPLQRKHDTKLSVFVRMVGNHYKQRYAVYETSYCDMCTGASGLKMFEGEDALERAGKAYRRWEEL